MEHEQRQCKKHPGGYLECKKATPEAIEAMTASLEAKRIKKATKREDTASKSIGLTGSRGSGTARRPVKRVVAAVQSEDNNESYDKGTLPSHAECLAMLRYEHDIEDGYDQLNVGHDNAEEAEHELWAKRTKVGQGMGLLQAGSTPSLVGGVSQDEDTTGWRIQSHVGSNHVNKRKCKTVGPEVEGRCTEILGWDAG